MRRRIEDKRRKRNERRRSQKSDTRNHRFIHLPIRLLGSSPFATWHKLRTSPKQASFTTSNPKEQLLEETLKYADRTNQIAIAEHLGVEGVTGEVLQDGIAYHCALGLKAISTGTVETNADRPEMVRLYTLLESEALSKDHPVHKYFEQREINLLKEYTFAAKRDDVAYPERTALQVLSAMEGLQLRWLNGSQDVDFVGEWKALIDLLIP